MRTKPLLLLVLIFSLTAQALDNDNRDFLKTEELREKLWRYDLKYALEVALSNSELNKIQSLANDLKSDNLAESAWNVLAWIDENVEYNYSKKNLSAPRFIFVYCDNKILDVEIVDGIDNIYQTPFETVKLKSGVCRDYAILSAGLLLAMNYSPYIFHIAFENETETHLSAAVKLNNEYFVLGQHIPILDLGNYYESFAKDGYFIDHAEVWKVEKTESFAKVRKVETLNKSIFIKYKYVLNNDDLNKIRQSLIELFEKDLQLSLDINLKNLNSNPLPNNYTQACIWKFSYPIYFYHPYFHNCVVNYFYEDMINYCFKDELRKYNRFWIDVLNDGEITIKLTMGIAESANEYVQMYRMHNT